MTHNVTRTFKLVTPNLNQTSNSPTFGYSNSCIKILINFKKSIVISYLFQKLYIGKKKIFN